jgi:hypothetical protein
MYFPLLAKLHPYSERIKTLTNMNKTTTRDNAWKFRQDIAPPVGKCMFYLLIRIISFVIDSPKYSRLDSQAFSSEMIPSMAVSTARKEPGFVLNNI